MAFAGGILAECSSAIFACRLGSIGRFFKNSAIPMFEKLFGKKKENPVSTEAGLNALIRGMPSDDLDFIGAVDEWLQNLPALVNEIGLEICLRAAMHFDHASRHVVSSLLRDYLTTESDRHLSKPIHQKLNFHAEKLCDAYSLVVGNGHHSPGNAARRTSADVSPEIRKAIGLAYFRAVSLVFRLAKFRYQKPGAKSWQQAHSMLRHFHEREAVTGAASSGYDPNSDLFRAYLRIVFLALVPISNLSPQQIEFVARMLAGLKNIRCSPEPDSDTTHLIDISTDVGPIPYKQDFWPTEGAVLFYLSVSSLRGVVQKFQEALGKKLPMPRDFADLPINRSQVIGVLSVLNTHWTNEPPNRCSDRIVAIEAMRGALGFNPALNLVEISEKTHSEGPITDPHSELLNRLWQLEEKVNKHRLEDWIQVDGSDEGVGVSIPMIQSRHVAGSLVSMRYADEPGWHLGIVRRVGMDHGGSPRLGLGTFPGSPKVVQIHMSGNAGQSAEAESGIKAIVFDVNNHQLLLPAGTYAEGLKISFALDSIQHHVSLIRLIEGGPDFELAEYSDE